MLGFNPTTSDVSVKLDYIVAEDILVDLPPLADDTPVQGIIGEGRPIGVSDVDVCGRSIGINFDTMNGGIPYVEIGETSFPVSVWRQRRLRYRSTQVIETIEQLIERARSWQPQLFN